MRIQWLVDEEGYTALARWGSILLTSAIVVGGAITTIYCYRYNFYPRGITLTDGFFLVCASFFAAIGYAFFLGGQVSLAFAIGRGATIVVEYLRNRHILKRPPGAGRLIPLESHVRFAILTGMVFQALVFLIMQHAGVFLDELEGTITAILWEAAVLAGLQTTAFDDALVLGSPETAEKDHRKMNTARQFLRVFFISCVILFPAVFSPNMASRASDFAFRTLGVKIEHANIVVEAETARLMVTLSGDPQFTKRVLSEGTTSLVRDIHVIFTGVGALTVVELKTRRGSFSFGIPSDKVVIAAPQRRELPESQPEPVAAKPDQPSSPPPKQESATPKVAQVHNQPQVLLNCDQVRSGATWQNANLFDLTYKCIPPGWEEFFNRKDVKDEVKRISDQLAAEITSGGDINPAIGNTLRAFYSVKPAEVRAVIMGQDPAPTKGQATGLSFSLQPGTPSSKVPSVQRVILEAVNEGFCMNPADGDLSSWAGHGALLLNTALTIPCPKDAKSCTIAGHLNLWEDFSRMLLEDLEKNDTPFTYILWGSISGQYASQITNQNHKVLKGGHPSPMAPADKFFCKNYFACTNEWLQSHSASPVKWDVRDSCTKPPPCIWGRGNNPQCTSACTMAKC